ncbi:MAG TPA: glycosyltransferase family 4 protein [Hydrogenophaga sp.]|uniref:glycosyltransferase family 4 protein n=1 Tax=Hydrogenophaga sp. TaxID=1904254 RepID=UPI002C6BCC87|nr:glycosyltransferase family 4 protein [Hydrogenophaga sp.]HMN92005.1 glycosyltransferase family 4 protein [Hydrogenophaga sp.]HMP08807.1 glycosyltransferase family 4 protein [Hydrogenophaga sp.]
MNGSFLPGDREKFHPEIFLVSPDWPPEGTHNGICTYVAHLREGLVGLGCGPTVLAMAGEVPETGSGDVVDLGAVRPEPRSIFARVRVGFRSRMSWSFGISDATARRISAAMSNISGGRPRVLEIEESFGFGGHFKDRDFALVIRAHGPFFKGAAALGIPFDRRVRDRCAAEARAVRHADGISAPSQYILDAISREWDISGIPTAVIPNPAVPVPPDLRWRPGTTGPKQILYVGRFDRLKGADLMLKAFNFIAEEKADVELLFAGPDRGLTDDDGRHWKLHQYAEAHLSPDARSRFRYLGVVSRTLLQDLRRTSAVCVVASREETFSYAALEALGAGCPLVAARMGGVPEMVADEHNGLLFESGRFESLAAQLLRVLEDNDLCKRLSVAALESFDRYLPANVAQETLNFYARVCRLTLTQ